MRQLLVATALIAGCDWDLNRMNDQPRCEAGDARPWLADNRCDHAPPPGTVTWRAAPATATSPLPTRQLILRGADRYARICAACHGLLGDANTPVARDMTLRRPPSLHTPAIVGYRDQRIYEVISEGYGLMPSYTWQLVPADRWAIVHYVRVLQRSQAMPLRELSAARQQEARPWTQ